MWTIIGVSAAVAAVAGMVGFRLGLAQDEKNHQRQVEQQNRSEWNDLVAALRKDILAWIDEPDVNQPVDFARHDRLISRLHPVEVSDAFNTHVSGYRGAIADAPELLASKEDAEKFTQVTATATAHLEQLTALLKYRD